MKKDKQDVYNILCYDAKNKYVTERVKARKITLSGRDVLIRSEIVETTHGRIEFFIVSDFRLGMTICEDFSRAEAIEKASKRIKERPDVFETFEHRLALLLPINK